MHFLDKKDFLIRKISYPKLKLTFLSINKGRFYKKDLLLSKKK